MSYPLIPGAADRLRAVADVIEAHPEQYAQWTWFDDLVQVQRAGGIGACGSAGCAAGHLVAMDRAVLASIDDVTTIGERAAELLTGQSTWLNLFTPKPGHDWPDPWRAEWDEVAGLYGDPDVRRKAHAQIAASYLRHLAEKGCVE